MEDLYEEKKAAISVERSAVTRTSSPLKPELV
jgi:hypothetical protein